MKVRITYCVVWNYEPRAAGLAAEIRSAFGEAEVTLQKGHGGVLDVEVDGRRVFSKHESGRWPEPGELVRLLGG